MMATTTWHHGKFGGSQLFAKIIDYGFLVAPRMEYGLRPMGLGLVHARSHAVTHF